MERLNYGEAKRRSQKPKTETMPYKPSSRGGGHSGPVPSEASRGRQAPQQERNTGGVTPTSPTVNKIYRPTTMRAL